MQIQVHTDRHIPSDERLAEFIRDTLQTKLSRFADHLTRVEVHLSDENGQQKNDGHDKRCLLEARFEGLDPVAITEHAATVGKAITGAADKMQRKLSSVVGKLRDKHVRAGNAEFVEPDEVS
jgi:ribosome-associated translation inhibitor RaiA